MTLRERLRRWNWNRLHRKGKFPRGRTASPEKSGNGTSPGGRATFAGDLSARVVQGGKDADV
jgi:hypothetical protein